MLCTQDQSHFSHNEAAVLGQLRKQKLSASSEKPSHWNQLEKKEKETKSTPVRHEKFISKAASRQGMLITQEENFVYERVRSPLVKKEFIEENEPETTSLH